MTQTDDTATALRELTETLTTNESVPAVLQRVCMWVVSLVPDATAASVTLIENGRPRTIATTDERIMDLDRAQYDADDGPCLHALRTVTTVRADAPEATRRWPEFADAAASAGIVTVLACALVLPDAGSTASSVDSVATMAGAVNVWSDQQGAFDPVEAALVTMFTGAVSAVVLTARRWERAAILAENLQTALTTRDVIATAKGIVMARREVDADEAFAWIIDLSQRTNRKIRDLAAVLVEDPTLVELA
ncbi:ANTAR domain-containing protein [Amycolatopsis sp. BJA-103]|uniref:ANTAR domain-containing protein n=1 Tax=unclassified Amycolatopsis TaxID=2618356 RepID=UPI000C7732D0|nr:ANTAR domain-containing protein [Amycolatopsis sp. BJA-103]AUI60310.1 ANTAR domain-containing protein [Amycolatopsis sp. BJA-103]PNE16335.1 ANTAR domain-containing protein [Amycolatopsis sp. BJA-103]